jgi:hypothetical protein
MEKFLEEYIIVGGCSDFSRTGFAKWNDEIWENKLNFLVLKHKFYVVVPKLISSKYTV